MECSAACDLFTAKLLIVNCGVQIDLVYEWRCPWCNGYRRRKWTRRQEFKSWTRLIAFHIADHLLVGRLYTNPNYV